MTTLFFVSLGLYGLAFLLQLASTLLRREAGKKAASRILDLQKKLLAELRFGRKLTAAEFASCVDTDDFETVFHILTYLAKNGRIKGTGDDDYYYAREFYIPSKYNP